MTVPVIPSLAEVLKEARDDRGIRPEPIAISAGRSKDTVITFERGGQYAGLDRMVSAYAEQTGFDVFELWRRAIDRAEEAHQKLTRLPAQGEDADAQAARAVEEAAADQAQQRGSQRTSQEKNA